MNHRLVALVALALLLAVVFVGNAVAAAPPMTPAQAQAAGQQAQSGQSADTTAGSGQYQPSNTSVPVRIGSGGNGGDVTQTNASVAAASSANSNKTDQSADQTQSGGSSGPATQAAGQEAKSDQDASSKAESTQTAPTNVNVPIRILSPGDDGDTTQTNASEAAAASANGNATDQSADQTQSGTGGAATQAAGQASKSDQSADSDAESTQSHPSNVNVPIRILSPGDDGDTTQTNASLADAASANGNTTDQSVDQTQSGGSSSCRCSGGPATQAAGQEAKSEQTAKSDADSTQKGASNVNVPIRILSPGRGGDVTQTNASTAAAASLNGNKTDQSVDQTQTGGGSSCRCSGGLATQAAGQASKSDQWADSDGRSTQKDASNLNAPVRIASKGDGGDVTQTNASMAAALSANGNHTDQSVDQTQRGSSDDPRCGCGSGAIGVQAAGQEAKSEQGARSDADSAQYGASNANVPVRIGSRGDDGDVTQTNLSAALAASLNGNKTDQSVDQTQGGATMLAPRSDSKCGCSHGLGVQAAGQEAKNDQWSDGHASSRQSGASNVWDPVRIDSRGGHGDVTQLNASLVAGGSANGNATRQHGTQVRPGHGTAEQALGQASGSRQKAGSDARSTQGDPTSRRAARPYGGRHLDD